MEIITLTSLKFLLVSVSFFLLPAFWLGGCEVILIWILNLNVRTFVYPRSQAIVCVDTATNCQALTRSAVRKSQTWQWIMVSVTFIEVHSFPPYAEVTNSTWRFFCLFVFLLLHIKRSKRPQSFQVLQNIFWDSMSYTSDKILYSLHRVQICCSAQVTWLGTKKHCRKFPFFPVLSDSRITLQLSLQPNDLA